MDLNDLENRFTHHPPHTQKLVDNHSAVRATCDAAADRLNDLVPDGREKALAITKLEEAMFWANAAIARSDENAAPRRKISDSPQA